MTVRKWHMRQATGSFTQLTAVLPQLTQDEVLAALDLESQSNRRKSTIDRLISRAVRLNELAYSAELNARYRNAVPKQPQ
jgi:hypothetical protein